MWRLRNRLRNSFSRKIVYQLLSSPLYPDNSGALRRSSTSSQAKLLFHRDEDGSSLKDKTVVDGVKKFTPITVYAKSGIQGASVNDKTRILNVAFDDASLDELAFPVIWLRDNCQCPNCFDKMSHSRILDQQLLKSDVLPKEILSSENSVKIQWDDGHVSDFSKDWLCRHSFSEQHQRERDETFYRIHWTAQQFLHDKDFRKFAFKDVISDDSALLDWLQQLAIRGVAILTDASPDSGILDRLARRVAFIRKTHYGEQFSVVGSDDANNVAYKKGALQLHTDLPYYNYMPGIIMLQCVKQSTEGGENILSDGFGAAAQLSESMYKVLTETVVDWLDIGSHDGERFHSKNKQPVLCLDSLGNLEKINWSQPQRDSIFNVSLGKVIEWYEAAIEFTRLIHDRRNAVVFKSQTGEILTFDNRRILHGRANYSDSTRLLYGAYIDWDEIYSRIRVLKNQLKS